MSEQLELPITTKEPDLPPVPLGDTTNFGRNFTEFQETLWETLTFQRNINPLRITGDAALGMAMAVICAGIKARDIAKADMYLWRKQGKKYVQVEPKDHWFARMLARRPNEYHSWAEFWRMVIMHYALTQNAYILKFVRPNGQVDALIPLPTGRVQMMNTSDGRVFYEIAAVTQFEKGVLGDRENIRVPAWMMIHLRGRMYDGAKGLSNTSLGAPFFELIGAIGSFQANLFKNDARQPIVFESDTTSFATGDQADAAFQRLKQQLREAVRRMNQYGDPILLEAGYKAKVVAQNARDAMTKEAFDQVVLRICALMETPPSKIYALDSIKYDNQAELNAQYANDILLPIANDIRDKFKLGLLTQEEWEIFSPEFDQMQLLAGDPKTLMEIIDKAMKSSLMTVNEGRERLPMGLNPTKGGDVRLLPVNFALVDEQGNITQLAGKGQANNDGTTPNTGNAP
jgi:HK97 family phage portal protein